ncbi:MAG TPA: hypothetical protein PKV98_12125 [Burkholderiaceae bacterium]|nr:hypothetical protein [Burkholderiaceae bacterium]
MHDPWLLPTPLTKLVSNRISIGRKPVAAEKLAQPEFVASLSEANRDKAAQVILDRIVGNGRYMAALRTRPVSRDIAIPADFGTDKLSGGARDVFDRVFNGSGFAALDDLTWGQILDNRRTGVERLPLMVALAELEWKVHHFKSQATNCASVDALTKQLRALLDDERIDAVKNDDLRLGWRAFGSHQTLSALIRSWLDAGPDAISSRRHYIELLSKTFAMNLAEDISDIGAALAQRAFARLDARARNAEVFAARFGARDYGPQLEAIAKRLACSGARVSQIEAILLKERRHGSLCSPAALTMLNRIASLSYLPAPQLEQGAGLTAGQGDSLRTFRRFCLTVLKPTHGFDIGEEGSLGPGKRHATLHEDRQPSRFRAALKYAKREARIAGAANIGSVAGAIALDTGKPVVREELERMIDEMPQFTWLDRDLGWFAVDDLADSLIHSRVLKLLAVAKKGLSIREIGEALWRDTKFADESQGEAALAPMAVLKKAILGWPDGIKENARGFLSLPDELDLAAVLSPLEKRIFKALAEQDGVATAASLAKRVGGNVQSLRVALSTAVFAYPLGQGLYALRGWPISERDILAAIVNKVSERTSDSGEPRRPRALLIDPVHLVTLGDLRQRLGGGKKRSTSQAHRGT